jgi:hypothetical protein
VSGGGEKYYKQKDKYRQRHPVSKEHDTFRGLEQEINWDNSYILKRYLGSPENNRSQ